MQQNQMYQLSISFYHIGENAVGSLKKECKLAEILNTMHSLKKEGYVSYSVFNLDGSIDLEFINSNNLMDVVYMYKGKAVKIKSKTLYASTLDELDKVDMPQDSILLWESSDPKPQGTKHNFSLFPPADDDSNYFRRIWNKTPWHYPDLTLPQQYYSIPKKTDLFAQWSSEIFSDGYRLPSQRLLSDDFIAKELAKHKSFGLCNRAFYCYWNGSVFWFRLFNKWGLHFRDVGKMPLEEYMIEHNKNKRLLRIGKWQIKILKR